MNEVKLQKRARQIKLPRRFYKRIKPPPAVQLARDKKYQTTLVGDLTGTGVAGVDSRIRGKAQLRDIIMQPLATNIVNRTREIHINRTMERWRELRAQGYLDKDVAILVDASPGRPIKNVSFAGTIQILAPQTEMVIEAAKYAYNFMINYTSKIPRVTPQGEYNRKKRGSDSYGASFVMFINDDKQILPKDLDRDNSLELNDTVAITNFVPYAAKLERYRYPVGTFLATFKQLRKKYGKYLAIRFDFVEGDALAQKTKQGGAIPNAQPVIRIANAGTFPSRAPNMRKITRNRPERSDQRR